MWKAKQKPMFGTAKLSLSVSSKGMKNLYLYLPNGYAGSNYETSFNGDDIVLSYDTNAPQVSEYSADPKLNLYQKGVTILGRDLLAGCLSVPRTDVRFEDHGSYIVIKDGVKVLQSNRRKEEPRAISTVDVSAGNRVDPNIAAMSDLEKIKWAVSYLNGLGEGWELTFASGKVGVKIV